MKNRIDVLYNFWKLHRCGVFRLLVVDFMFDMILLKEYIDAHLRRMYQHWGWIAFYPERRRIVFYILHYKVIMWLSVDETGTHAV